MNRPDGTDRLERERALVERVTRIMRLLTWIMALACAALVFAMLATAARAEDPKAVARELGQAGNTAAGAIARDASNAGARCRAMPGPTCRSAA